MERVGGGGGEERKEITVTSGSGILCFYVVGMRESQGEQSGIRDFKFLRDHIYTEKLAVSNILCV